MMDALVNSALVGALIAWALAIQPRVRAVVRAWRNPSQETVTAARLAARRIPLWIVTAQIAGGGALAGLIVSGLQGFAIVPSNPNFFPVDLLIGWGVGIAIALVVRGIERGLPSVANVEPPRNV